MDNEAKLIIILVIVLVIVFVIIRRTIVKVIKGTIKNTVYNSINVDEVGNAIPKKISKEIRDSQATDVSRYESSATTIVENPSKTYPTNCPNCGGNLDGKSNKCPYCGTKF